MCVVCVCARACVRGVCARVRARACGGCSGGIGGGGGGSCSSSSSSGESCKFTNCLPINVESVRKFKKVMLCDLSLKSAFVHFKAKSIYTQNKQANVLQHINLQ